ncbi:23S rRNA (adenine(1618)-N(6))-methyltransferase RlmF [Aliiglaciecola litoralis]|uniref:Ribosomal RNA large subunit methyltransferase F n=1 Tax=Aliiglaciecola litoralis TaxID=582857 RepID=A0ABN1LIZ1_9ALTE
MHPRNLHKDGYDFTVLVRALPSLSDYLRVNPAGRQTIDFADPNAVKALNAALLKHYYRVSQWDIPAGYLCPPVPGRADYIHHIADLLAESNNGVVPTGNAIRGLDIGTGANLIYPIIGKQLYDWRFVASDIDKKALQAAKLIQSMNAPLNKSIDVRLQTDASCIFSGIVGHQDSFSFSMCNPPFHASEQAASQGSMRKQVNLDRHQRKRKGAGATNSQSKPLQPLNFAGTNNELWCDGGEVGFILRMIEQSAEYARQIGWFTCLVSSKESLKPLYKKLDNCDVSQYTTIKMGQGNKQSRFLAWRY